MSALRANRPNALFLKMRKRFANAVWRVYYSTKCYNNKHASRGGG